MWGGVYLNEIWSSGPMVGSTSGWPANYHTGVVWCLVICVLPRDLGGQRHLVTPKFLLRVTVLS